MEVGVLGITSSILRHTRTCGKRVICALEGNARTDSRKRLPLFGEIDESLSSQPKAQSAMGDSNTNVAEGRTLYCEHR